MRIQRGFTLIEVLIALVILAISLTALMMATSRNVEDLSLLRQKTVAMALANNALAEVQMGFIKAPKSPFITELTQTAFQQSYRLTVSSDEPILPGVTPVIVNVYPNKSKQRIAQLKGFQ